MPQTHRPTPNEVLDTPFPEREQQIYGLRTIREFFVQCMYNLWVREQLFDGARPLGHDCWVYHITKALVAAGYVTATVYEDGSFEDEDTDEVDWLIQEAIEVL